jgi:putative FmdB family regulatory protein
MPIYEFRCRTCGRKTSAIVLVRERIGDVRCSHCGGADLARLVSRFATLKSEDARLDALGDPSSLAGIDENDPKSVARWMKRMGDAVGEDLGEEFEQAVEQEAGEGPDGNPPDDTSS